MKDNFPFGEQKILSQLANVSFTSYGSSELVDPQNIKLQQKEAAQEGLRAACTALKSGRYDLVVLDEVNVATGWGLVDVNDVLTLVKEKPAQVELILTGRYAPPELVAQADLVTEMCNRKHPFEKGVSARTGIEY
jgi:cob(I)alamin adenosyltransferase